MLMRAKRRMRRPTGDCSWVNGAKVVMQYFAVAHTVDMPLPLRQQQQQQVPAPHDNLSR
jgi:hypothetical protein